VHEYFLVLVSVTLSGCGFVVEAEGAATEFTAVAAGPSGGLPKAVVLLGVAINITSVIRALRRRAGICRVKPLLNTDFRGGYNRQFWITFQASSFTETGGLIWHC